MNCPLCGADTKVIDTRSDGAEVRRRRECKSCGHRFTTYEVHNLVSAAAKDRAIVQLQESVSDLVRIIEEMKGGI